MKKAFLATGILLSIVTLTGCGEFIAEKIAEKSIEASTGGAAKVDFNSNGQMAVTTKDGTASFGNTLPANWPTDVAVYPVSTIVFSSAGTSESNELDGVTSFTTKDSIEKVVAYYAEQLKKDGWEIKNTANFAGTNAVTAEKEGRALSVTIAAAGDETAVTIGFGNN